MTKQLEAAQKRMASLGGSEVSDPSKAAFFSDVQARKTANAVKELQSKIAELNAEIARTRKEAADTAEAMRSLELGDVVRRLNSDLENRKALEVQARNAAEALNNPRVGGTPQEKALANTRAQDSLRGYTTQLQASIAAEELATRSIYARSPAQRAAIAADQKRLELGGQLGTVFGEQAKNELVAAAAANARKQAEFGLSEAARERLLSARQSIDAQKVELSTIGESTGVIERARMQQSLLAQAEAEAARSGTKVSKEHKDAIAALSDEYGRLAQKIQQTKLSSDLSFERSQIGLSDEEQANRSRLRSVFGDNLNTEAAQSAAAIMRVNDALRATSDTGKDALKGFIADMRSGKTGAEAFANSLSRIADKLIDMAVNNLWGNAFGGGGGLGGGLASLLGLGGSSPTWSSGLGAGTGGLSFPTFHTGGIVGTTDGSRRYVHPSYFDDAPRFHTGGIAGDEVPLIAKKGEGVFTPQQMKALGNTGETVSVNYSPTYNVQGSGPEIDALRREIAKDRAEFPARFVDTYRKAKTGRHIS